MLFVLAVLSVIAAASASERNMKILEQSIIIDQHVEFTGSMTIVVMPKHNSIQAQTMITDHDSKYSIRMLPDQNVCFVMKDDPAALPTEQVWGESAAEKGIWANVPNVTTIYRHMGSFKNVDLLPEAMTMLCSGLPIIEVGIDSHQEELRDRSVFTADPGQFVEIDYCPPHAQAQACKMFGDSKTCHYVQICDSTSGAGGKDEAACDRVHKFGEVRCCIPCCLFPVPDTNPSPYCMDPKIDALIECKGYGF